MWSRDVNPNLKTRYKSYQYIFDWEIDCVDFAICFYCRLPTDIQNEGVPMILGGGDVLMVCNQIL